MSTAESDARADSYACHYCRRTNGRQTRDHKVPKFFGGEALGPDNIVLCCHMCNTVKDCRDYALFVLLFKEFLAEHGEHYRAADPDTGRSTRRMMRTFNDWLYALQHTHGKGERAHVPYVVARGVQQVIIKEAVSVRAALRYAGALLAENYREVRIHDGKGNQLGGDELLACYLGSKRLTPDLRAV